MTREDAYYERIMLLCGWWDNYDEWLDSYLKTEAPISHIVLELVESRGDMNEILHRLNLYCLEAPFDEESVYVRLRTNLRDRYKNGDLTEDQLMSAICRIYQKIPSCDFQNQCLCLSDYYDLAENGIVDINRFNEALDRWLDHGGRVNTESMFYRR